MAQWVDIKEMTVSPAALLNRLFPRICLISSRKQGFPTFHTIYNGERAKGLKSGREDKCKESCLKLKVIPQILSINLAVFKIPNLLKEQKKKKNQKTKLCASKQ